MISALHFWISYWNILTFIKIKGNNLLKTIKRTGNTLTVYRVQSTLL